VEKVHELQIGQKLDSFFMASSSGDFDRTAWSRRSFVQRSAVPFRSRSAELWRCFDGYEKWINAIIESVVWLAQTFRFTG
jgi:hypothetical protein